MKSWHSLTIKYKDQIQSHMKILIIPRLSTNYISKIIVIRNTLRISYRTRQSNFTFTFHVHALEKEMATHSSVLAWRIPGTGEPHRLPSMGSHRVRHDWSDLAAAAATAAAYTWQLNSLFCVSFLLPTLYFALCWPHQVTPPTATTALDFTLSTQEAQFFFSFTFPRHFSSVLSCFHSWVTSGWPVTFWIVMGSCDQSHSG